ncbi:hypothetical protein [Treponema pectinovorum]|uniref:hypothetical protein n=1 Tax=Treponema pectinovorum TaxID=164 RepID=UPI0011C9120D|nr:hypothetical protein [Treponema pectinovorum]
MEKIIQAIKEFLLENVNEKIQELGEQEKCAVPKIESKNIIHGIVDISRLASKCIVSIMEDEQKESEGDITSFCYDTDFTITFLSSGESYEKLVKNICIYASAMKKAMQESPTFNLHFVGSGLKSVKLHYDCGAVSKQMTAAEIELTVRTEE